MLDEGRALRELHEHIVVKVPFNEGGLEVASTLTGEGVPVNMTLVFSPTQALLAASAGATYVSCFMGRLDDISVDSSVVLEEIADSLRAGGMTSEIIAASIRHPEHVVAAARIGCEIATTPAKVLRQMLNHPLTDAGAEKFRADWQTRPEFGEWLRGLTGKRLAATGS
jgi:transaldolase